LSPTIVGALPSKVAETNWPQSANAVFLTLESPLGIVTLVKPAQYLNAEVDKLVTADGIEKWPFKPPG
jgi:hypothetical protein